VLSKFEVSKLQIDDKIIDLTKSKSQAARAMHACLVYLEKEAIRHQFAEVAHFLGVAADATVDAVMRLEQSETAPEMQSSEPEIEIDIDDQSSIN
jgi:hypothetical protein